MSEIIRPTIYPECQNCPIASENIFKAAGGPPSILEGRDTLQEITHVECIDMSSRSWRTLWLYKRQWLDMWVWKNDYPAYMQDVTAICPGKNRTK